MLSYRSVCLTSVLTINNKHEKIYDQVYTLSANLEKIGQNSNQGSATIARRGACLVVLLPLVVLKPALPCEESAAVLAMQLTSDAFSDHRWGEEPDLIIPHQLMNGYIQPLLRVSINMQLMNGYLVNCLNDD